MQADAGFVEHIEHAGEPRADLTGEANALAFPARQGAGGAPEAEIVQAYIIEEFQPVIDLFQDAAGDFLRLVGERILDTVEPVPRLADREDRDIGNVESGHLHGQGFRFQPLATTGRAGLGGLELGDLVAHPGAVGFAIAPFQVRDHPLEGLGDLVAAHAVIIDEVDLFLARAMEDDVMDFRGELVPGLFQVEAVMGRERLQGLGLIGRGGARPGRNGAVHQVEVAVGHDKVDIHLGLGAEAIAGRAGAEGIVEREQARLDLGNGEPAFRAGEIGAVGDATRAGFALGQISELGHGDTVCQLQRCLEALRQALFRALAHDHAVDHDVHVVLVFLVERGRGFQVVKLAVHLHPLEAFLEQLGELLAVFPLAAAHDGREQVKPRAVLQAKGAVDHLRDGLALDRQACGGRIGDADARPQKAHIVIDLRHRADG